MAMSQDLGASLIQPRHQVQPFSACRPSALVPLPGRLFPVTPQPVQLSFDIHPARKTLPSPSALLLTAPALLLQQVTAPALILYQITHLVFGLSASFFRWENP